MCIYSTGELISPDLALQAFIAPTVPAAATMYLMEYNIFNISEEDELINKSEVCLA